MKLRLHLCVAGLLISSAPAIYHAQLDRAWTTGEAVARAGAVVNARVLSVQVREQINIYTFVEFETLAVAKGSVPARFTYRMLGGKLGGVEVSGGEEPPSFRVGEEVVVLLGPETAPDGYPTLFWNQVYRVSTTSAGTKLVSPPATGLPALAGRAASSNPSSPTRLDDFLSAVKLIK
jgi:hypothetical protein